MTVVEKEPLWRPSDESATPAFQRWQKFLQSRNGCKCEGIGSITRDYFFDEPPEELPCQLCVDAFALAEKASHE